MATPRWENEMSVNMDDLNLQIIKHLRDGRKSFGKIAQELDVTENTVRSRVKKLVASGVLDISGNVNPYTIPGHFLGMVGIRLSTTNLVQKGEEFATLRGVISVAVVTGQYDLIVTVLFNDDYAIKDFYTKEVPKVDGVASTETWVVYHNVNATVPYVL